LRLDLAAFRELEAFAQLGTELDAATQSRLDRGYRMVEVLKQGQYAPMDVIDQIMIIFAGTRGHIDTVPVGEVQEWEKQFLTFMQNQKSEVRNALIEKKDLTDEIVAQLESSIKEFHAQYAAGKNKPADSRTRETVAV
jgi:F-type H+-transporting ATPase subunit alpha